MTDDLYCLVRILDRHFVFGHFEPGESESSESTGPAYVIKLTQVLVCEAECGVFNNNNLL